MQRSKEAYEQNWKNITLTFCKEKHLPINSQFLDSQFLVLKREKCSNRTWINGRNSTLHFT